VNDEHCHFSWIAAPMACNDKRDEGPDYTRNDKGDKTKQKNPAGAGLVIL